MLMDMTEIITAILALIGSVLGSLTISLRKRRVDAIKEAEREAKQEEHMETIEKKLDEHNGYAVKISSMEKSLIAMQKDIEYIKGKDTK